MSNFIEYPCLNKHPCDWRNSSDETASDCTIILHNDLVAASGTGIGKYSVHLRILSLSSDYFYRVPMMNSQGLKDTSTNIHDIHNISDSCQGCNGDLNIKFHDGKCIRMGSIKEPFLALKQEIQERCGIPIFEQRLIPCSVDDHRKSLQDWRSPAACEFREGDTLLLVHQPWQNYDPCTKTLELYLPGLCTRCVFRMRHNCSRNVTD